MIEFEEGRISAGMARALRMAAAGKIVGHEDDLNMRRFAQQALATLGEGKAPQRNGPGVVLEFKPR